MADAPEKPKFEMTPKNIGIAIAIGIVAIIIIWQVLGMFGGSAPAPSAPTKTDATEASAQNKTPPPPKQATFPPPPNAPEREQMMSNAQVSAHKEYIDALSALQMLKINRQIAEQNKAINDAKLSVVTSQKQILDVLAQPIGASNSPGGRPPGPGAQGPATPPSSTTPATPATPPELAAGAKPPAAEVITPVVKYGVVSVTQIMDKWSAVLAAKGSLIRVEVGDQLEDKVKVVSIGSNGVVIDRDGKEESLTLPPTM